MSDFDFTRTVRRTMSQASWASFRLMKETSTENSVAVHLSLSERHIQQSQVLGELQIISDYLQIKACNLTPASVMITGVWGAGQYVEPPCIWLKAFLSPRAELRCGLRRLKPRAPGGPVLIP
ncbi:hypothetical protein HPB47_008984 [Ixodes persulcatus]|uniref:Uncharacterized protein n=1 Tax=Ixodes persulcatus TaxID=34615 RepID=A0AC60P346_IXOPE|nr:hypothetical protein HPB47_008984 [Ixodes persulcatus]